MSLDPFSVFATCTPDDLESLDAELLSLIAGDDDDTPFPMELESCEKTFVDDFTPLKLTSTPTTVDALLHPGFSKLEVQDLMNLLAPEPLKIPTFVRSYSEPIPKIGKRTKKCTYAARRKEVAFLREESMKLEKRLNDLRVNRAVSSQTRERVALEKHHLVQSKERNKQLRALVSSQEEKIRQADTSMVVDSRPLQFAL